MSAVTPRPVMQPSHGQQQSHAEHGAVLQWWRVRAAASSMVSMRARVRSEMRGMSV